MIYHECQSCSGIVKLGRHVPNQLQWNRESTIERERESTNYDKSKVDIVMVDYLADYHRPYRIKCLL